MPSKEIVHIGMTFNPLLSSLTKRLNNQDTLLISVLKDKVTIKIAIEDGPYEKKFKNVQFNYFQFPIRAIWTERNIFTMILSNNILSDMNFSVLWVRKIILIFFPSSSPLTQSSFFDLLRGNMTPIFFIAVYFLDRRESKDLNGLGLFQLWFLA